MFPSIAKNIPVLIVSFIATITTATVVVKASTELLPLFQGGTGGVVEARYSPGDQSNETPQGGLGTSAVLASNTAQSGMTIAILSAHNTPSSCYIAYAGVVYDVTSHPSWQACIHHGQRGGTDITASFPHSTAYFSGLTKVGQLVSASGTVATAINIQPPVTTAAQNGLFTPATLATHNTGSSCFIAYAGNVYDVTTHPSWKSCVHHGQQGGKDITALFPHAVSYFSSLPKVGTLTASVAGTTTGTTTPAATSDDGEDDRHEDEDEKEEVEVEDEESHEED